MKPKSELSLTLYGILKERGYSEELSDLITKNLNTDFTAGMMIGYLAHYTQKLPEAELVDEMLSILALREQIMQKKNVEAANAEWNELMQQFPVQEEDL